ncbi:MAG: M14 family zinc carboxypeptidase [Calditrichia bacterium]
MKTVYNQVFTKLVIFLTVGLFAGPALYSQADTLPFFPDGQYQPDIPTPETVLGFSVDERPVRYAEMVAYFTRLAEASERVQLVEFGETFEKRKLHYLIISSQDNLKRVEEIRSNIEKLADPRKLTSKNEFREIIQHTPAIAWMMYGIHGDELSSGDAALQLAYQLAAGLDTLSEKIRQNLVVCIHPLENPDGRERFLNQIQQWSGLMPSSDVQSIQHTAVWPWGRGNHYLFDLNRDWILLVNPETRARVSEILKWNPQLVVDSHEMGPLNTYLFSPGRDPFNPQISETMKDWSNRFAAEQARAFDRYGWSYYTREWLDEWYPGYGSIWPFFRGAVGILYEQAGTDGSPVKRHDSTLLTFRESVHHQFVSSLANLETAADSRESLLTDFYWSRKKGLDKIQKGNPQAYYLPPGQNPTRVKRFIENLTSQGIEVLRATKEFTLQSARDYWTPTGSSLTLPEGTYVIPLTQPLRPLIEAMLDFDPRMTTRFLEEERKSLLQNKGTRMYEVSAWSLPLAYGLKVYRSGDGLPSNLEPVQSIPEVPGMVSETEYVYGFIFDYQDDNAVLALKEFLERGYQVRVAQKDFKAEGNAFQRGALLLRVHENGKTLFSDVKEISRKYSIKIFSVHTARAESGPDLGGGEFRLLRQPRIALLTGSNISTTSFSALWYLLDQQLKIRHSILAQDRFSRFDLRKYNVIILPSCSNNPKIYQQIFGKEGMAALKSWVENGGTLIGIGNGAAFLADSASQFSKVRLRRQALKDLNLYENIWKQEKKAGREKIDSLVVWESGTFFPDTTKIKAISKDQLSWIKLQDERARLFQPRGAILRANLDEEHWLTFGVGNKIPVIFYGSYAFLSKAPVQTVGGFAEGKFLRLSGLLWPEARSRWQNTAYLTREKYGKGQLILFAGDPFFRAYFHGSGRLLINSLLFGPGLGTEFPVPW